jgi:hypothetical protein
MRSALLVLFTLLTTTAGAKDVYLTIGGSVTGGSGQFRTDMRLFNPSPTKDIIVQAYLLPADNNDNSGAQQKFVTVPKRTMLIYDDVVSSLFNASGLAAIRLRSDDDFVATQRIYQVSTSGLFGTLGQFVPGIDTTFAKTKGVIIQLKSGPLYRTNVGIVNPNFALIHVTWRLYDRNSKLVNTRDDLMPPFGVIPPQNIGIYFNAGSADLTDAWVSVSAEQPVLAYGSVIDAGTGDPTFIPMSEDTGAPTP